MSVVPNSTTDIFFRYYLKRQYLHTVYALYFYFADW